MLINRKELTMAQRPTAGDAYIDAATLYSLCSRRATSDRSLPGCRALAFMICFDPQICLPVGRFDLPVQIGLQPGEGPSGILETAVTSWLLAQCMQP